MKQLVAFALVILLTVGLVAVPATAEGETDAYKVGYCKVDINPYWKIWVDAEKDIPVFDDYTYQSYDIMPLPMAGYGNNQSRLAKPKLMDDNGSGVNASGYSWQESETDVYLEDNAPKASGGDNDGDGLWGTVTAISQGEEYFLIVCVDMIGINSTITRSIKNAIIELCGTDYPGLSENRILINSNHTHGGVDLSCSYEGNEDDSYSVAKGTDSAYAGLTFTGEQIAAYLKAYRAALVQKLAAAALAALQDRTTALSMEKGTIDAGLQTGHHMNGVRHKVQTYNGQGEAGVVKPEITYVRGSSFNNDIDPNDKVSYDSNKNANQATLTDAVPVSESDDKLHVLKFTFAQKDPVVLVNFRAHSTANNKSDEKALHYNISADWVSPLRKKMEDAGYRFGLLYGSSGNLGTDVANDTDPLITTNAAQYVSEKTLGISTGIKSRWVLPATQYGWAIADAALALLNDKEANGSITGTDATTGRKNGLKMTACQMGPIYSMKYSYKLPVQKWPEVYYQAALAHNEATKVTYPWLYKDAKGNAICDENGTPVVIASQYHANHVISKYTLNYSTINLELNTVTLGNKVAFATTPIEASDRYSLDAALGNFTDNDWDDLINEDGWGTPFVLSLTNNSSGYIPNNLAYEYNKDYANTPIDDTFEDVNGDGKKTLSDYYVLAVGSYESHSAFAEKGQGEAIVAKLNEMLRSTQPRVYVCPHCGTEQTFLPFGSQYIRTVTENDKTKYVFTGGHYYLWEDFTYIHQPAINSGTTVCLDLNGHTYSIETTSAASRAATVAGTLNVMDTSQEKNGVMQGQGVAVSLAAGFTAGTINIGSSGTVNLYSGNLTMRQADGCGPSAGGVLSVAGTFRMYGGTIYGGISGYSREGTGYHGGNIYVNGGTFDMYGGTIRDGQACGSGGNIYVHSGAVNLYGGNITGGTAVTGNSVYINGGSLTLSGTAGSASPIQIRIKQPEELLTVSGTYTGQAEITPASGSYGCGDVIALAKDADISGAQIKFMGDESLQIGLYKDQLWLVKQARGGVAAVGAEHYNTVAQAINAYTEPAVPVRLLADAQLVRLTKDLQLDLNGHHVTAVTAGGYQLTCLDSATDDYASADADSYGTVPVSANAVAAEGYLPVTQSDAVSFHKYELKLVSVALRPNVTGIYYACRIAGDELVKSRVREFGVAMSIDAPATAQEIFMDGECKTHVWFGQEAWNTGASGAKLNGVVVQNIMRQGQDMSDAENERRANLAIYGVVYMTLEDGTVVFGEPKNKSLREFVEYVDANYPQLINDDLIAMYRLYENVMKNWSVDNLEGRAAQ